MKTAGGALLILCLTATAMLAPSEAVATYQCGNVKDDCQCGGNNPYPCCDNGSNCTWWAWEAACCNWKVALPGWGNANTWASYASKNGNYQVLGNPVPGSIATSTKGGYGHVAWVESVNGNKITVSEMNCCGSCPYGKRIWSYDKSYFNSGFVVKKGLPPPGPVCPNGKCEGGENCASCAQDCGSCCGNGACDNGENCASCPKDCGGCCGNGACDNGETCATCSKDCVCLPQGALEAATCSKLAGWAQDPDTPKPVPVTVREGGVILMSGVADLPHPAHDGHGFWWATPKTMKDNKVHTVEVHASDDNHPQHAVLGPSAFVCNNGPLPTGAWQTQQKDHAGCGASLPPGDGWMIRHAHEAGFKLPLSGLLTSCLTPLPGGFNEGFATLQWSFGAMPFAAALREDGQHLGNWTGTGEVRVDFGPGKTLCLDTLALQEVPVGVATWSQLGPVWVRQGPWWWVATSEARGWLGAAVPPDGIEVTAETEVQGGLRATLGLGQPFDQLTWTTQAAVLPPGTALTVRTGTWEMDASALGWHDQGGLWGQEVAIQASAPQPTPAGPTMVARIAGLRARQNVMRKQGAWQIRQQGSYGLYADVSPTQAYDGLDAALLHRDAGWWTTGRIACTARITHDQVDRVRGRLLGQLQEPGLRAALEVGGVPVWSMLGGEPLPPTIDVSLPRPATDGALSWSLSADQDRWHGQDGTVRLSGLQWRSRGWWTAPSYDVGGWRDRRTSDGGARIEADQLVVAGQLAVQLQLPFIAKAVRLHYRQDLRPIESEAAVRFGGQVVHTVHAVGIYERDLDLPGPTTDVMLSVTTNGEAVALVDTPTPTEDSSPRWAEVTGVEVQAPDGQWVAAKDLAQWVGSGAAVDAGGDSSPAPSGASSPPADGGCGAGPGATGSSTVGWWWGLILAVAVLRRRSSWVRAAR